MVTNYKSIEIVSKCPDLEIFYGVSKEGTPVWGRMRGAEITEAHPIYSRNRHSAINNVAMKKM